MLGLLKIENIDIYITGSNSKFLSSEIMTEFRDRGDEIHIMPLTFKEYCDWIVIMGIIDFLLDVKSLNK